MIPPPDGLGSSAKYSEIHCLNLRLIRHLQQSHLKLSGIKEYLESKSLAEKRNLLISLEAHENSAKFSFEDEIQLTSNIDKAPMEMHLALSCLRKTRPVKKSKPFLLSDEVESIPNIRQFNWRHIQFADGVELNIREDTFSKNEGAFVKLIAQLIKETLEG
jgi:DNA-binding transcriptional MerR regulator